MTGPRLIPRPTYALHLAACVEANETPMGRAEWNNAQRRYAYARANFNPGCFAADDGVLADVEGGHPADYVSGGAHHGGKFMQWNNTRHGVRAAKTGGARGGVTRRAQRLPVSLAPMPGAKS